jgi:hypothetical protein
MLLVVLGERVLCPFLASCYLFGSLWLSFFPLMLLFLEIFQKKAGGNMGLI